MIARRLHRGYLAATVILFAVEVVIALFVRDRFVRPYLGDTLAVMLVYCGVRAISRTGPYAAAVAAFAIAALVEFGQLVGILDLLGLRGNAVARVVLGTGFEPLDFVAYAAGALAAILLDIRLDRWCRRAPRH
ncbi:DUF2809 domain-containing protein [Sphingomonas sp.]|uniref:ribosomal maturation YjgA family protein n=1 Tax=Sphingomonas sp. TaxID=28214 RepID=UPI001EB13D0A|nr:DUF2809 domain-containing protein [Sphingomonas sp.]MBX3593544.1 DUF2809 domain-containing protein [Sphingomonas sp.]